MEQYGVIGYPVKHSLSPVTHTAGFHELGIKAEYQSFEVEPSRLSEFMVFFKQHMRGMNVTIPHKEAVMEYLDEIDPDALAIGAVNTVINRNGKLVGYNTDSPGSMIALHEIISGDFKDFLAGKDVVVLGAGGAGRALVYGILKHEGAVILLNRHVDRAIGLVDDFTKIFPRRSYHFGELSDFDPARTDVLVNTTPVGMSPADDQVPIENFKDKITEIPQNEGKPHRPFVMDIVYRPRNTRLIREARELGCPVITGERMFLHQAILAFEIWTGQKAPVKVMEEAIMASLS